VVSIEENKALVRRYFDAWNGADIPLEEILAPNVRDPMAYEGQSAGIDGYREFFAVWRAAFPDLHSTIEEMIAEGDLVATRWSATGTHLGPYHEHPPTGRRFSFMAVSFARVAGGKIVEDWYFNDHLALYRQLGIET